jgi:hypothetical protein
MLTVGTDTYISLTDAALYLSNYYTSTDAKYTAWSALSDSDCEVLLRQALQIIDRQPFTGVKAFSTQTLAFPRAMHSDWMYALNYIDQNTGLYSQTAVPDAVKYAQCEIAITLAEGKSTRMDLQQQGVKSYSIGNLSETFGAFGATNRIPSAKAAALLKPYLAGAVNIV